MFGWFKNTENVEPRTAKNPQNLKPEVLAVIAENPKSFHTNDRDIIHWIKIITKRPKEYIQRVRIERLILAQIIKDLEITSHSEYGAGCKTSQNYYKVKEVQALLDYALATRAMIDYMMIKSVEGGIAHYDSTGTMHFNDKDTIENDNTAR